jgi:CheY-like chemotaxis protein
MGRVILHGSAKEASEGVERVRRAGHETELVVPSSLPDLGVLWKNPPDAFIIDLSRRPSDGWNLGIHLRRRKATRRVPLVFAAGDPQKVARARELLPDAVFAPWSRIRSALRRAMANPPADPVVRGVMAGYSGTPLPKKLGIRGGVAVALLGAPQGFESTLGALPEDVRLRRQARGRPDLVLLFVKSRSDLRRRFPVAARALADGGGIWIAWPKKTSGIPSDLTQTFVRSFGLDSGFVDYKICAIDEIWSGLKFARRR